MLQTEEQDPFLVTEHAPIITNYKRNLDFKELLSMIWMISVSIDARVASVDRQRRLAELG